MATMQSASLREFQDRMINSWPALQTLVYGGWLLRFADGFTKRANSVYPMTSSSNNLAEMIDFAERVYIAKDLDVTFRMTDVAAPSGLDDDLAQRGYEIVDPVSVQSMPLIELPLPSQTNITLAKKVTDAWLDDFCTLRSDMLPHKDTMRQMFSKIVPETCFATIRTVNGELAGCGFSVLQDGYAGIFDLYTNPRFREQGFASSVIAHLMRWAIGRGAHTAYLQVVRSNEVALNLYRNLGFRELYGEWYRVKRRAYLS